MTALNVIVDAPAIHIVTDGTAYTSDHLVKAFAPKVVTLPHLAAAVAVSGPAGLLAMLGDLLFSASAADLDGLIASPLAGAIGQALAAAPADARIVVAGHARHGPAAWHLAGNRFEVVPTSATCAAYYLSPAVELPGELPHEGPALDGWLVELVARQRERYPVGGFVALTTIRPDAIEQRVLHRWADRVGDVLGSAGGLRSTTVDSGVSS